MEEDLLEMVRKIEALPTRQSSLLRLAAIFGEIVIIDCRTCKVTLGADVHTPQDLEDVFLHHEYHDFLCEPARAGKRGDNAT